MDYINIQLLRESTLDHRLVSQCLKDLERIVLLADLELVVHDPEKEAQAFLIIKEEFLRLSQMKG